MICFNAICSKLFICSKWCLGYPLQSPVATEKEEKNPEELYVKQ